MTFDSLSLEPQYKSLPPPVVNTFSGDPGIACRPICNKVLHLLVSRRHKENVWEAVIEVWQAFVRVDALVHHSANPAVHIVAVMYAQ